MEKWRPKTFDDFVFQDADTKSHIMNYVSRGDIGHLMFSGPPGTGKSSCALLLVQYLHIDPMDVMTINASKENSMDTVRTKISDFCGVSPFNSPFKVVILEEADWLTAGAQGVLRRIAEDYWQTVRFILTCNYPQKLKNAIDSRMQHYVFQELPLDDLARRVTQILDGEGVSWTPDDVFKIIESSPRDLRKIVNMLEQYTVQGILTVPTRLRGVGEFDDMVKELLEASQFSELTTFVGSDIADDLIPPLYRVVYDTIPLMPSLDTTTKVEQAIVTVAEYMFRSATVADQYINFAAMLVELKRI